MIIVICLFLCFIVIVNAKRIHAVESQFDYVQFKPCQYNKLTHVDHQYEINGMWNNTNQINANSSLLSYNVCTPQPDPLIHVSDASLTIWDNGHLTLNRIIPVCSSTFGKSNCLNQLQTGPPFCLHGQFDFQISIPHWTKQTINIKQHGMHQITLSFMDIQQHILLQLCAI